MESEEDISTRVITLRKNRWIHWKSGFCAAVKKLNICRPDLPKSHQWVNSTYLWRNYSIVSVSREAFIVEIKWHPIRSTIKTKFCLFNFGWSPSKWFENSWSVFQHTVRPNTISSICGGCSGVISFILSYHVLSLSSWVCFDPVPLSDPKIKTTHESPVCVNCISHMTEKWLVMCDITLIIKSDSMTGTLWYWYIGVSQEHIIINSLNLPLCNSVSFIKSHEQTLSVF